VTPNAEHTLFTGSIPRRVAEALRRELGDRPVRTPLRAWVVAARRSSRSSEREEPTPR